MMLRTVTLSFLLFTALMAHAQGVEFVDLTWDKVIDKAKEEHKLVFVDVYAEWCAPCKKMDRVTFPDKEVGDLMNAKFVSYKADYKTPTGNMLAKKYGVGSFPTYLFLDPNGEMIYKARGFMESSRFIKEAQVASNPGMYNKYKLYRKKFNAGNRDPEMLHEYLILGADRYKKPSDTVYYAFYESLNLMDKQEESNLKSLSLYLPYADGPAYDLVVDYYSTLDDVKSYKADIGMNLHDALDRHMHRVCKNDPEEELPALLQRKQLLIGLTHPADSSIHSRIVDEFELHYLECGDHWMRYAQKAGEFIHEHMISAERLHLDTTIEKSLAQGMKDLQDAQKLAEFANHINDQVNDDKYIQRAIEWIDQAIRWNDTPEYHGTKAFLLKKQGDLEEAVNVARRALEKARKSESDYAKQLELILLELVDGERNKGINPGR